MPDSYETSESFDVVLLNYGGATHVTLQLDDALSDQLAVEAPNHHVAGGTERRVTVARTGSDAAHGNLRVITDHGANTRLVEVRLTEPVETETTVEATGPDTERAVQMARQLSGTPERPESSDSGQVSSTERDDEQTWTLELNQGDDGAAGTAEGTGSSDSEPAVEGEQPRRGSSDAERGDSESMPEQGDGESVPERDASGGLRPAERRALAVGAVVLSVLGLTTGVVTEDRSAMLVVVALGAGGVVAAMAVNRAV
ncbi:hypothetical protein NDI56_07420 [Haloarcula sp. S1CR25-12]|uniref:Uncharacterized protein n=1 Tax=Haloarcula saliterrae TaxID=2950534 RepID=A0ABU2FBY6_9EURY|nr:hypothetical protein [Haloarcula sp. S1CR25-12]MDS0259220.1 hypothetical protein [Haloarcula sp. S1CR25-12]